MKPPLTIGEVAEIYGVSFPTLRFYEETGLLAPERRGAIRLYHPSQVARVKAILERRRLGFTLAEIAIALAIYGAPLPRLSPGEVEEQIDHLHAMLAQIDVAIAELKAKLPVDAAPSSSPPAASTLPSSRSRLAGYVSIAHGGERVQDRPARGSDLEQ